MSFMSVYTMYDHVFEAFIMQFVKAPRPQS